MVKYAILELCLVDYPSRSGAGSPAIDWIGWVEIAGIFATDAVSAGVTI
jgi:hypothetical protein